MNTGGFRSAFEDDEDWDDEDDLDEEDLEDDDFGGIDDDEEY